MTTEARGLWPWIIAALALILALVLALIAPRPILDNRVEAWIPQRDQAIEDLARLRRDFGSDEAIAVVLEGGDPEGALRFITALRAELEDAKPLRIIDPGLAFPDEVEVLLDPDLGGFKRNWPNVQGAFDGPLNDALRLFEPKPSRAGLYLFLDPALSGERAAIAAILDRAAERAAGQGRRLRRAGEPLVNLALDQASREVESRSMPVLIGLCLLLLLVVTRSPRLTLALFIPVGLGVLSTEGMLGALGVSANLMVAIVKPLLFVLLLAGALHVGVVYQARRAAGLEPSAAAWGAARDKASACIWAFFTTAIGFGSLALSEVGPIRTFGLLAAAGLVFGSVLVLFVVPAFLVLVRGPGRSARSDGVGAAALGLGRLGRARPALTIGLASLLALAGLVAALGLRVEPHAINYFPEDGALRRDHDALEAEGYGLASVELLMDLPADPLKRRPLLEDLDAFARQAAELPDVRAVLGLPLLLREAAFRGAGTDGLPAASLLRKSEEEIREQAAAFLTEDGRGARLSVLTAELDAEQIDALVARLIGLRDRVFRGEQPGVRATGSYRLLLETQRALLRTLRSSLIATAVLMELVFLLALRSLRLTLLAFLPNVLPVALNFMWMRIFEVPVDVGTAMTATIALGIAVDGTLHFLIAWKHGRLDDTLASTGTAILITTVVICAGFTSLLFSDFGPSRAFGGLCAAAMVTALIGDLVVLPALLKEKGPSEEATSEGQPG